jgi:hypothetical protein
VATCAGIARLDTRGVIRHNPDSPGHATV